MTCSAEQRTARIAEACAAMARRRQAVARAVVPVVVAAARGFALQQAIPGLAREQVGRRQRWRERRGRGRRVVAGIRAQRFGTARKPARSGVGERDATAIRTQRRRVAFGQARGDETAGAAAANDVAVGDELVERPVDGVAGGDAEVVGQGATAGAPRAAARR
ncbi:hypothetical protein FE772_22685 [Lysobacter enzymogenes]|nr:hypothetical protein FE772_22685 [Lysobacter enzymogenes]